MKLFWSFVALSLCGGASLFVLVVCCVIVVVLRCPVGKIIFFNLTLEMILKGYGIMFLNF